MKPSLWHSSTLRFYSIMRVVLVLGLHYPEAADSETVLSGASPPKYLSLSCLIAKE